MRARWISLPPPATRPALRLPLPLSPRKCVNHGSQRRVKLLFGRNLPHKELTDKAGVSSVSPLTCSEGRKMPRSDGRQRAAQMKGAGMQTQRGGKANSRPVLLIFDNLVVIRERFHSVKFYSEPVNVPAPVRRLYTGLQQRFKAPQSLILSVALYIYI